MVSADDFIEGETNIQWKELAFGIVGGMFLAAWEGIIRIVLRIGDWSNRFLEVLTSGQVNLIDAVMSGLRRLLRASWADVGDSLDGTEVLSWPIAVAIVVVVLVVLSWTVIQLAE